MTEQKFWRVWPRMQLSYFDHRISGSRIIPRYSEQCGVEIILAPNTHTYVGKQEINPLLPLKIAQYMWGRHKISVEEPRGGLTANISGRCL